MADSSKLELKFVIAGGQNGADVAALRAATAAGIETQGYMVKDFRNEKGNGKLVAETYDLDEIESYSHSKKDRANVDMASGCIGFLLSKLNTGRGTTMALRYAVHGSSKPDSRPFNIPQSNSLVLEGSEYKAIRKPDVATQLIVRGNVPILIIWDISLENKSSAAESIKRFCCEEKLESVFVGGPCESTQPGIEDVITECLLEAWKN